MLIQLSVKDGKIAFFPCIRFTQQAELLFNQAAKQYRSKTDYDKISSAMQFEKERYDFFDMTF